MREAFIKLRVSAAARNVWIKAAAASGHSLSAYIRLSVNAFRRGQTADLRAELVALRCDLNGAANNFNQLCRRLHATGQAEGVAEAAASVARTAEAVRKALEEVRP